MNIFKCFLTRDSNVCSLGPLIQVPIFFAQKQNPKRSNVRSTQKKICHFLNHQINYDKVI